MKQNQNAVYRLPCAGFAEKDGSFTNSARWLLWKNTAVPTPEMPGWTKPSCANFLEDPRAVKKEGGKFPDPS